MHAGHRWRPHHLGDGRGRRQAAALISTEALERLAGAARARVGVISDTHCPEFVDTLPGRVLEILAGVDLIVHLGDVTGASTLEALGALAPVVGVRGDHDRADLGLPGRQVITIAGHRVGLLHGNRSHLVEEPITFVGTVTLGFAWVFPGLNAWLRRQFADVDVVIHGHTHRARVTWYREVLLFNPGGVYQIGPETCRQRLSRNPGWFEWCWLQVAQFIRLEYRPTVGLLELGPEEMRASIVSL